MIPWLRATLLAGFLAAAPPLAAHAIHTSVAEADYNAAPRRLALASTPPAEFDAATRAYLASTFTVRTPDGQLAPLVWVGREVRDAENELWFHFEIPLPDGIEGCRVHHRALGEQFPTQINSVRVRDGERRVTLVFLARQTEKTVRFRP